MLFDDILATLRDNGKSGLAYQKTIDHADRALEEDPDRAVGYRLLCAIAERFIESTGRLPVTTVQTEKAFSDFADAVSALKDAYTQGDAEALLGTLNTIAISSRQNLDLITPIKS
jgi:hypothetical protein